MIEERKSRQRHFIWTAPSLRGEGHIQYKRSRRVVVFTGDDDNGTRLRGESQVRQPDLTGPGAHRLGREPPVRRRVSARGQGRRDRRVLLPRQCALWLLRQFQVSTGAVEHRVSPPTCPWVTLDLSLAHRGFVISPSAPPIRASIVWRTHALTHRHPHLHGARLAVRPSVIRNERYRHGASALGRICAERRVERPRLMEAASPA